MFLVGAAQLNQPKRDGVRGGGGVDNPHDDPKRLRYKLKILITRKMSLSRQSLLKKL